MFGAHVYAGTGVQEADLDDTHHIGCNHRSDELAGDSIRAGARGGAQDGGKAVDNVERAIPEARQRQLTQRQGLNGTVERGNGQDASRDDATPRPRVTDRPANANVATRTQRRQGEGSTPARQQAGGGGGGDGGPPLWRQDGEPRRGEGGRSAPICVTVPTPKWCQQPLSWARQKGDGGGLF